ncbi:MULTISPECIES: energy transducer TonB [Sphingobacterium]|uniref:Energy transducer TonB n=1 Tax=Sphingobacterium thalpophilum TaxID=259 RepID=A0ACD5C838_9SPHI|nr:MULTISPECIES: energy transducer TonB [Sphingobacterium]
MKPLIFSLIGMLSCVFSFGQENAALPKIGYDSFVKQVNRSFKLTDSEISKDISGEIILDIRVNEFGKIDSADIAKDIEKGMGIRLLKAVKMSGDWEPATKNGKPIASWVRFPYKVLSFKESANSAAIVKAEPIEGMSTFIEKFYKNFQYPPEALKAGLSGDYELNFIVKEDGKITGVKLKDDPGYGVLTSAQRALNRAGKWKPATQNGEAVKSSVVVPFKLNLKEFRTHI